MKVAAIVRFKRNPGSELETGVGVVPQAGTQSLSGLLDTNGRAVVPHDFTIVYIFGSMIIPEDIK